MQPIGLIGSSGTNAKGNMEPISTISIHHQSAVVVIGNHENTTDDSKNCWDPLEPAYDRHGNRKNGEKKVTWSDNILNI